MTPSSNQRPWTPQAVASRVERARGALLANTGRDVKWADIGRYLGWTSSATASDAKAGRRPLRVDEIGDIAELLECSPGWLAFAEGAAEPLPVTPPPLRPPSDADHSRKVLLAGGPGAAQKPKKRA